MIEYKYNICIVYYLTVILYQRAVLHCTECITNYSNMCIEQAREIHEDLTVVVKESVSVSVYVISVNILLN
jgi:hypothetical protein